MAKTTWPQRGLARVRTRLPQGRKKQYSGTVSQRLANFVEVMNGRTVPDRRATAVAPVEAIGVPLRCIASFTSEDEHMPTPSADASNLSKQLASLPLFQFVMAKNDT